MDTTTTHTTEDTTMTPMTIESMQQSEADAVAAETLATAEIARGDLDRADGLLNRAAEHYAAADRVATWAPCENPRLNLRSDAERYREALRRVANMRLRLWG